MESFSAFCQAESAEDRLAAYEKLGEAYNHATEAVGLALRKL